jgi:ABC-2 type transport system ATP-binding protein
MICSRVLIVDGGRVIAEDTPENLTRQLRGTDAVQLEVRGPRAKVIDCLRAVKRVLAVNLASEGHGENVASYNIATDPGADIREDLSRAIVNGGFGLLELRTAGMSLEDVFLKLITEERDDDDEEAA